MAQSLKFKLLKIYFVSTANLFRTMRRQRLSPRDYIIYLLGRREYSEAELRTRLKTREGVTSPEMEEALAFVKEHGLQSDARYAASKARMESRRKGNRSIARTLNAQGIDSERITEELAALAPETERVIAAVRRYEGKRVDQALKGKVWRFLVSRGFSSGAIDAALTHLRDAARQAELAESQA